LKRIRKKVNTPNPRERRQRREVAVIAGQRFGVPETLRLPEARMVAAVRDASDDVKAFTVALIAARRVDPSWTMDRLVDLPLGSIAFEEA